jgi:hypothetical protein
MLYPGRVIKAGERDTEIVRELKLQLNKMLVLENDPSSILDPNDPNFGPKMKQLAKLFQARHMDSEGKPLRQDGEVGSLTWGALFDDDTVPASGSASDTYLARVITVAAGEEAKHVREVPANSNRGPDVERYQHSAGASPGNAWCCAFVYWCFNKTANDQGRDNPMVRTAGCLDHWRLAPAKGVKFIAAKEAVNDPDLVKPGMIFIIDHGKGKGHTGLVESTAGALLTTIEGNTDASKTREGGGVYRLTRKVSEINKGYIDYTGC